MALSSKEILLAEILSQNIKTKTLGAMIKGFVLFSLQQTHDSTNVMSANY